MAVGQLAVGVHLLGHKSLHALHGREVECLVGGEQGIVGGAVGHVGGGNLLEAIRNGEADGHHGVRCGKRVVHRHVGGAGLHEERVLHEPSRLLVERIVIGDGNEAENAVLLCQHEGEVVDFLFLVEGHPGGIGALVHGHEVVLGHHLHLTAGGRNAVGACGSGAHNHTCMGGNLAHLGQLHLGQFLHHMAVGQLAVGVHLLGHIGLHALHGREVECLVGREQGIVGGAVGHVTCGYLFVGIAGQCKETSSCKSKDFLHSV